jgi:F-type H+-transporting ATPase subunit c
MAYSFLYFFSAALVILLTVFGVSIGQSLIAQGALDATNIQPKAINAINKTALLGIALTETSAVLSLVLAFLLIFTKNPLLIGSPYYGVATLGIALAMAVSGMIVGLSSGFPAKQACLSISRQPFFGNKISNLLLLSLSFIQTPIIFGFIVSLFIWYQLNSVNSFPDAIRLLSAGLSIALGGIGPAIGLSSFSKAACESIGYNKKAYQRIVTFTFISQALIETPIIFALITSLILLTTGSTTSSIKAIAFICSAISIGVGTLGPGLASGNSASKACLQLAKNPNSSGAVSKISMLSQGFIDSCAIYAWLISLMLILFT